MYHSGSDVASDKCWLERFSEWELRDIVPTVIANTGYGHGGNERFDRFGDSAGMEHDQEHVRSHAATAIANTGLSSYQESSPITLMRDRPPDT